MSLAKRRTDKIRCRLRRIWQGGMKGRIAEYDPAESKGMIAAFNTMRYGFSRADWIDTGEPAVGQDVEFRIDEKAAREVVLRQLGASQIHREI